jgi:hypothetical protein
MHVHHIIIACVTVRLIPSRRGSCCVTVSVFGRLRCQSVVTCHIFASCMLAKSDAACTTSNAAYTSKTRGRSAQSCTAKYRIHHQGREHNQGQNMPWDICKPSPTQKEERNHGQTRRAACLLPKLTVMLRGSCDFLHESPTTGKAPSGASHNLVAPSQTCITRGK